MILVALCLMLGDEPFGVEPLFFDPQSLRVNDQGEIWVPDRSENAVFVFAPSGALLRQVGQRGQGPGEFVNPTDVGFLEDGRVVVVDSGNGRVQFFDSKGTYLDSFHASAHSIGRILVFTDQTLLLTETNGLSFNIRIGGDDSHRRRFYVYDQGGEFVRAFGALVEESNPLLGMMINQGPIALDKDAVMWASCLENQLIRYRGEAQDVIRYPLTFAPVEAKEETKSHTNASGETTISMSLVIDQVCMGMDVTSNGDVLILRALGHTDQETGESYCSLVRLNAKGEVKQTYPEPYLSRGLAISPDDRYAYVLHEADDWTLVRVTL